VGELLVEGLEEVGDDGEFLVGEAGLRGPGAAREGFEVAARELARRRHLGIASLVFQHGFGFSGTDASVPLYGFVFLVALGVDYNIFLMSRIREETLRHGTRQGVLRGLIATGGVITSVVWT
jgi:hypothetical protein